MKLALRAFGTGDPTEDLKGCLSQCQPSNQSQEIIPKVQGSTEKLTFVRYQDRLVCLHSTANWKRPC
jgi:hypothetical protein